MCDLRLPHQAVSMVHAMVLLDGDRYYLVDPGSMNGTTLGGEVLVIERRKLLRSGDVIGIAGFEIEFSAGVALTSHHSRERTSSVARLLATNMLADDGQALREPSLVVVSGPQTGERLALTPMGSTLTVGRSEDNDFILDDSEVSRRHLAFDLTVEGVTVRDLGGKNALLVNDRPVQRARLRDRDELLVGATRLVFDEPVEAYLRELASLPDIEMSTPSLAPPEDLHGDNREEEAVDSAPETPTDLDEVGAVEASETPAPRGDAPPEGSRADDGAGRATATDLARELGRGLGASSGVEIAILLVGALVLAACVGALVWIFR